MMITSPLHTGVRPTASLSEPLGPVFRQPSLISLKLVLEFFEQVIGLLDDAVTPPCALLLVEPGDELQVTFVEAPVLAFAVPVIPSVGRGSSNGGYSATCTLVRLPVFRLTFPTL